MNGICIVKEKLTRLFSYIQSWQDGNPEYLSDLDRQVMQKNRLRQVSSGGLG